ncbi:putative Pre-rRNA-processing protein esf2 [Blattamonas nauphoetae]|uniref:Pre-rRNA-processing protein esf2 n=1 Tax=Blattamonas nauphoetae TaxID=2049346 RepID=A0ABQ9XL96_9EUKA|nr:putative Pre-rRNA-processing protein esf2 [Blattamonas nauphoetae]
MSKLPGPTTGEEIEKKLASLESELNGETYVPEDKRGVIYLSRIPMFMKVEKLRHILSQYGEIDRIYLNLESNESRRMRIQKGGNRKHRYVDGWVEFLDKRMAKLVALSLNNTPVGGKTRFYREDIWNIKYLPKFKWNDLTNIIARRRAEKESIVHSKTKTAQKNAEFLRQRMDESFEKKKISEKKAKKLSKKPAQKE